MYVMNDLNVLDIGTEKFMSMAITISFKELTDLIYKEKVNVND